MKTRIGNISIAVSMVLACLGFVVAATFLPLSFLKHYTAPVQVAAQSGTKYTDEETVTKVKTMIFDGSKQMIAGAKMMREAMQTMREGKNPTKGQQIMTEAERIITEGEKTLGQAQEMAEKHSQAKEKMELVTERYNEMIHGSKIMRTGMMMAEGMLTEGPHHLAKDAKKVTAGSETEKGH
jgi:uncharacterized Zn-binding protein involved in type VI secretion